MRGVLACAVMLFHLGLNNVIEATTKGFLRDSQWHLSVDFFFILSGFVICASFTRRRPTLLAYFSRRTARLAPLYVCTLLASLALSTQNHDLLVIVSNFVFTQPFFGLESINYPSWTIPFEFFTPVAFLLFPFVYKWSPVTSIVAFCALGTLLAWSLVRGHDNQLLRAIAGLGLGFSLCAQLHKSSPAIHFPHRVTLSAFAAASITMLISGSYPAASLAFYPLSALAIISGTRSKTIFSSTALQYVGSWSYGIYLIHIPMLMLSIRLFGRAHVESNSAAKVGIAAATILAAAIAHHYIEQPFMALKRKNLSMKMEA